MEVIKNFEDMLDNLTLKEIIDNPNLLDELTRLSIKIQDVTSVINKRRLI